MTITGDPSDLPITTTLDPRESVLQSGTPGEETVEIHLSEDNSSKKVYIGSSLSDVFRENLIHFLTEYQDVFAWSHSDMPGIDPSVVVHLLNVDSKHKPVHQRR